MNDKFTRTMSRVRRIGCGLAALATAAATACGPGQSATPDRSGSGQDATLPSVEVIRARGGTLPLRERLSGSVRAAGQVVIYPEVSGPVTEVLVSNGDRVERGDPLVRIRAETSQSQLQQARAQLNVAQAQAEQAQADLQELESQFKRTRTLAEDDLVSEETVETQRAQLESARAAYRRAQAQVEAARATVSEREEMLSQSVVRAPISGRVGRRNAEVGMRADAQTALFTIGSLDNMRVQVPVPQDMLTRIDVGQPVEIRAETLADTAPIAAEVSRISPFLEEGSFSAEVEIDVPNHDGRLLPGMFVVVDLFYGETDSTTVVPKSALYDHPDTGIQGVYLAGSPDVDITPAGPEGTGPLSDVVELRFQPVKVFSETRHLVGLRNVEPDAWVVVVGQHLLSGQGREDAPRARVRSVSWDRVVDLQGLQRQDLLRDFMAKQQRIARQGASAGDSGIAGASRSDGS